MGRLHLENLWVRWSSRSEDDRHFCKPDTLVMILFLHCARDPAGLRRLMSNSVTHPNPDGLKLSISHREFVAMMAMIFGLQALGIDLMLPALEQIGTFYQIENANSQQWIVISFVLGFGFPQLIWGPIADRFGRKILLQLSLIGYAIFAMACMLAPTFESLLFFRLCQGIACSGTRVSAGAIIRDVSSGRAMARIMSLVFTVFMVVPAMWNICISAGGMKTGSLRRWHPD
jgi:MFS family permease